MLASYRDKDRYVYLELYNFFVYSLCHKKNSHIKHIEIEIDMYKPITAVEFVTSRSCWRATLLRSFESMLLIASV